MWPCDDLRMGVDSHRLDHHDPGRVSKGIPPVDPGLDLQAAFGDPGGGRHHLVSIP